MKITLRSIGFLTASLALIGGNFTSMESVKATDFTGNPRSFAFLIEHPNQVGDSVGIPLDGFISDLSSICLSKNFWGSCVKTLNDSGTSASVLGGNTHHLVLWEHAGFQGRMIVLGGGDHDLRNYNFDDMASSMASYTGSSFPPFFDKFYKSINDPTVYWYGRTFDCRVTDPAQMERFGGFGRVNLVSPNITLPTAAGNCGG